MTIFPTTSKSHGATLMFRTVISGVADRVPEKVASLVYLDAFVPENGQSLI